MTERRLATGELTELLERFPVERAGSQAVEEVTGARIQLLLARIAALTAMLRDAAPDETADLVSRLLLNDLAAVAAHFRGRANEMRSSLAKALADLREGHQESIDGQPR